MPSDPVAQIRRSGAEFATRPPEVSGRPAAILVPCSSLKSVPASSAARAVLLSGDSQRAVETAWLQAIKTLEPASRAGNLYKGRGFHHAVRLAAESGADLYVVSAGLGLIHADTPIPSYSLTLSGVGGDNVATKISERFNPSAWWHAVNRSPFAVPLHSIFKSAKGLVVAALSRPYARMIGTALAELAPADRARLRIVGARLNAVMPDALHPFIMPYDDRLTRLVPGAHGRCTILPWVR